MTSEWSFPQLRQALYDRHMESLERKWEQRRVEEAKRTADMEKFVSQLHTVRQEYRRLTPAQLTPEDVQLFENVRLVLAEDADNLWQWRGKKDELQRMPARSALLIAPMVGIGSAAKALAVNPAIWSSGCLAFSTTFLKTTVLKSILHAPGIYFGFQGFSACLRKTNPKFTVHKGFYADNLEHPERTAAQKLADAVGAIALGGSYGAYYKSIDKTALWRPDRNLLTNVQACYSPAMKPLLRGGAVGALIGAVVWAEHMHRVYSMPDREKVASEFEGPKDTINEDSLV